MSTVVFRRPPRRDAPAAPDGEVTLVPPPELPTVTQQLGQLLMLLPMLAGGGAMAFLYAGRGGGPLTYVVGGLFGVSMIGMGAASLVRPRAGKKAEVNDERRDYMRYLAQTRRDVRRTAARQRAELLWRHPDPARLWSVATTGRLWERRPSDQDFGVVRIGLGAQQLATPLVPPQTAPVEDLEPLAASALRRFVRAHASVDDLPVAVALRGFPRVLVTGDAGEAASLARAVVAQLVTFHAPEELQLWLCVGPGRRAEWDFAKWLPHLQHPTRSDAAGPVRLIAERLDDLEELEAADLTGRPRWSPSAGLPADEPHVVVVSDGGTLPAHAQALSPEGLLGVTLVEVRPTPSSPRPADSGARYDDLERGTLRLHVQDGVLSVAGASGMEPLGRADVLPVETAEGLARQVAPYRLGTTAEEEPLSADLGITELLGLRDPEDVDPEQTWRPRAPRDRLRVPLGLGADGLPVELDLKEAAQEGMGPHGLVIGATGSGKSELLRTLVLALAVTHSSETLNLVLVDFKGGATFAGLAELPHTSAVITNLEDELSLVARMRDALQGEMVRRQELLRRAGNYSSVRDYERARETGADLDPLPTLLIVCDEFSELLSAQPDFIDLFVAIGRLGRSLGIHLLLASQRLEEGRLRGLDSHLSYRIGLRTFSAAESRVVLGVPDAYELPSVPGSGFLKVDTTALTRFKAAYVSGAYRVRGGGGGSVRASSQVLPFQAAPVALAGDDDGRQALAAGATPPTDASDDGLSALTESVLDVVVRRLEGQGPAAHQVWLPPLSSPPPLDALLPPLEESPGRGLHADLSTSDGPAARLRVPVGWVDKPFDQRRDSLEAALDGAAGHVAVVGAPQSGKSTLLRSLVASLALTHTPREVQVYAVDLGGGALASLAGLPHVGSVAGRLDSELVRRTVSELVTLLEEREARFVSGGIDSMASYRRRMAEAPDDADLDRYGDVFLVIDGWSSFRTDYEALEPAIVALATRGLSYGVHVVVSTGRWGDIRPALRDLLGTRYELRLGDPGESDVNRRAAAEVPSGAPGRGLTRDGLHFISAAPRIDGVESAEGLAAAARQLAERVRDAWQGPPAPPVRLLPRLLPADDLAALTRDDAGDRAVPIGIRESDLGPVRLDFSTDAGFIVFGDVECGKSTLLRTIVTGVMERYTTDEARILLVDYRRSMLDLAESPHVLAYATASTMLGPMVADARDSMRRRLPGPDVTPEQLRNRDWWKGPELFVVVDDYDLVVTPSGNPLADLAELLPQARDIGLHLVLARRSGGAARALFEPVLQRLRELGSPGLVMSGDRDEGVLLGGVRPGPMPPGRGTLVTRRSGTELVQVAWSPRRHG